MSWIEFECGDCGHSDGATRAPENCPICGSYMIYTQRDDDGCPDGLDLESEED